jgi:putative CocE/NonD family hydrolase
VAARRNELDVMVGMRDGTRLATNLHRPDSAAPVPALLMRTPYGKDTPLGITDDGITGWTSRDYAVVVQDCRGRFRSEGTWAPFHCERDDGYDAVEWCAAQPWCNGKVGMFGRSYFGYTQLAAATARPPSLVAIAPESTGGDVYEDWVYSPGGVPNLPVLVGWLLFVAGDTAARLGLELGGLEEIADANRRFAESRTTNPQASARALEDLGRVVRSLYDVRPLTEIEELDSVFPWFRDWLEHHAKDAYWADASPAAHFDELDVPALHRTGWFDVFLLGGLVSFNGLRSGGTPQLIVLDPSAHGGRDADVPSRVGAIDFGVDSIYDFETLQRRWFDHWLKGEENGVLDEPPIKLFVMGDDAWRDEWEWPLARTEWARAYLRDGGRLSWDTPAAEPPDSFDYDPVDPVPTTGGAPLPIGVVPGPFDQREVESRPDVLVYVGEPLKRALEVTGHVSVELWAASDAPEADFTAKLVDVRPGGLRLSVCDGIVRAHGSPPHRIELGATSYAFGVGHRLGLEISSSNYPHFLPNAHAARQTVFHESGRPSCLLLPTIPRQ